VTRFRGLAAVALCLAAPLAARAEGPSIKWVSGPGVVGLGSQAEIRLKAGHAFANGKDTQALMKTSMPAGNREGPGGKRVDARVSTGLDLHPSLRGVPAGGMDEVHQYLYQSVL
jgi:hypothetical protein